MSVRTVTISRREPVRFRVREIFPNPFPAFSPSDEFVLRVERVGEPVLNFGLSRERFAAYRSVVAEAIASQQVYWVDWDYSKSPTFPPRMNDSTLDRLIEAINARQIVPPDSDVSTP